MIGQNQSGAAETAGTISDLVGNMPWIGVVLLVAMIAAGVAIIAKQYRDNRDD